MFITIEELKTHAHEEKIKYIIHNDDTIAYAAIDIALELASCKLAKDYDLKEIFSKRGAERSALLVKIIKDIAIWEIIGLTNPAIDYDDKRYRYEQAIQWLDAVYKGMPANLPRLENKPNASSFAYHSNPPRNNHY